MRARLALVVLAAGAVLLVACNGDDSTTSTTSTSRAKGGATTCNGCPTYDESDTAITASPGDDFVIELESNASTGYEWTATVSDAAVVRAIADEYVGADTDLVGAPGTQRFVFEPVAAGSASIVLRYARSFEPDDPSARELTSTVTVT
jgi:inhibitor of cysteine peptidase